MSISFISLVPDEIKTSALTGDTGYDTYLRDAHRQVLLYLKKAKYNYPFYYDSCHIVSNTGFAQSWKVLEF